jgi:hypothetical protein
MAVSNMEKNIFSDISTNSHRFFKSAHLYPRVAFSQYALKQFLNLYFVNSNDSKVVDIYFKILYLKNISNSLMMMSHYISLNEIENQKLGIEKKYEDLLFQAKDQPSISPPMKEDVSWIDDSIANVISKIDKSITDIAEKLKLPKKTIEKKIEKLFERFQEILSVSIYSFQKAVGESSSDELDMNLFKRKLNYHLQQHIHMSETSFIQKYWLTLIGSILLLCASETVFYPNIVGVNALILGLALGITGVVMMIANYYFENSKDNYTNFLQI